MNSNYIVARLATAFGCVVLVLLAIGWLGVEQMSRTDAALRNITNREWEQAELARQGLHHSSENTRLLMQAFLCTDTKARQALLDKHNENSRRLSLVIQALTQTADVQPERELLETIKGSSGEYLNGYGRSVRFLLAGDVAEARQLMATKVLPQLLMSNNAWERLGRLQGTQMRDAATAVE